MSMSEHTSAYRQSETLYNNREDSSFIDSKDFWCDYHDN